MLEIVHRQPEIDDGDDASWADVEFRDADLGDARLDRRIVRIAKSLAAAPRDSIPTASDGLAGALAIYRFFDNEKSSCSNNRRRPAASRPSRRSA